MRSLPHVAPPGLTVDWILETHVHADHLSAAPYLQQRLGGKIGIGDKITVVQNTFGKVFNEGTEFQRDGSQFDQLFTDGDTFAIGGLPGRVLHTPGHTPACLTYVIGDAAFVGDTMFMPDYGTARCDFPGGSAADLYDSIQKILTLPDDTRIFVCHDYKAPGRDQFAWESTVGAQKALNVHVGTGARPRQTGLRRHARGARCHAGHAAPDHSLASGEHARRPDAACRRQRKDVPESSDKRAITIACGSN